MEFIDLHADLFIINPYYYLGPRNVVYVCF